jgi:hypothetical protein
MVDQSMELADGDCSMARILKVAVKALVEMMP